MYEIEIKNKWQNLSTWEHQERIKIAQSFFLLRQNPYRSDLDIKKLINTKNDYRLRIGKYRFLYTIFENRMLISMYKADTRGDIYKG